MIDINLIFNTKEKTEKFILIYNKYKNIMFKYSYNILKDEKDAEDAAQNAFIKVINNLDK